MSSDVKGFYRERGIRMNDMRNHNIVHSDIGTGQRFALSIEPIGQERVEFVLLKSEAMELALIILKMANEAERDISALPRLMP
jgi:hypothetical protein